MIIEFEFQAGNDIICLTKPKLDQTRFSDSRKFRLSNLGGAYVFEGMIGPQLRSTTGEN